MIATRARRLFLALGLAAATALPVVATPASAQIPYFQNLLAASQTKYAAIVVDAKSGEILYAKHADSPRYPASITKIMTLYLTFEELASGKLHLDDRVMVSPHAAAQAPTKLGVRAGDSISVEEAMDGMATRSANDAAVAMAEKIGGTESRFAALMTLRAQELGMQNTHFVNASGLPDPNHLMTAQDLYFLAKHLMEDFPEYYHYFSEKEFTFNGIKQGNRNPLLYRPGTGVDGLKTGHTEEAGFGLTASAIRDGRRVFLIVHGLNSMQERADEPGQLLEWAFRSFGDYTIAKKGTILAQADVWMGQEKTVPLTVPKDLLVTLPVSDRDKVVAKAIYDGPIAAPIAAGQPVGELIMTVPGMPDFHAPLIAAADVPQLGFGGRVIAATQHLIFGSN
ncbi:MAG TPA: D-alanyl-D-alanine carboxypeptidase family protein [Dongiaceae bacterium]